MIRFLLNCGCDVHIRQNIPPAYGRQLRPTPKSALQVARGCHQEVVADILQKATARQGVRVRIDRIGPMYGKMANALRDSEFDNSDDELADFTANIGSGFRFPVP